MLQVVNLSSFCSVQLMHLRDTILTCTQYARCTGDPGHREDGARYKGRVGRCDVCATECIGQHAVLSSRVDRAEWRRYNDCNTCKVVAFPSACVERTIVPAANQWFRCVACSAKLYFSVTSLGFLWLLLS